jgi:hypothetical protein
MKDITLICSEFGLIEYRQELRSCFLSPTYQYQCVEKVRKNLK